jgi:hypothetical protein
MNTRAESMARHMWDARGMRQNYENLPDSLTPISIGEAYAARKRTGAWPSLCMALSQA